MSNLKTGLSIVAVAVLGAALVGPKIIGSTVESKVHEYVAQLDETVGYDAEVVEYNSGWFSSSAKLKLTLDLQAAQMTAGDADVSDDFDPIPVEVDLYTKQGPFIFHDGLSVGALALTAVVDGKSISNRITVENDEPLYVINNVTSLFGSNEFTDKMNGYEFDCTDCESSLRYTMKSYEGAGEIASDTIVYHGQGADSEFFTDSGQFEMAGLSIDFEGDVPPEKLFDMGIYDSASTIRIANMVVTTPNSTVELNGFKLIANSDLDEDKNLAQMTIGYGLEEFKDGKFDGQNFDLEMTFEQIDSNFFAAYDKFLKSSQAAMNEESDVDFEAVSTEFMDTHVLALLQAQPTMNITKLNGTFAQGSFDGNLNSQLVGITEMPAAIDDRKFWLSHTQADAMLKGDKALFEYWAALGLASQIKANPQAAGMSDEQIQQMAAQQAPMVLMSLVQQGMLTEDENQYVSNASLKDLQLFVNGMEIPLPL